MAPLGWRPNSSLSCEKLIQTVGGCGGDTLFHCGAERRTMLLGSIAAGGSLSSMVEAAFRGRFCFKTLRNLMVSGKCLHEVSD